MDSETAPGSPARGRGRPWPAVILIPLLLAALGLHFAERRGEFWLGQNYDPSYLYLFGALDLAESGTTAYVDHPGVPLQLLGAGLLHLRQLVGPGGPMARAVLNEPERFLAAVAMILIAVQCLVAWTVGLAVHRWSGDLPTAWAAQSSCLISATLFANLPFFKPEALLASLLLAAGGMAVVAAEGRETRSLTRALGAAIGLAIAVKVTAAPFALMLMLGPRRWRARFEALAIAAATALLASLPWAEDLGRFVGYLGRLAFRRGMYGRGEAGVENVGVLLGGSARLLLREPGLTVALLATGALVIGLASRRSAENRDRLRWSAALVSSSLVLIALAGKQPNPRFVVPALAAVGPMLALGIAWERRVSRARFRGWFAVAGLIAVAFGVRDVVRLDERWRRLADEGRTAHRQAAAARAEGLVVRPYFWASSPPLALWLGNRAVAFRYAAELEQRYPGFVMFDVWRWAYRPFSGEMNRSEDLPPERRLVLHGKRLEEDGRLGAISIHAARSFLPPFELQPPGDELTPIWAGEVEALYAVRDGSPIRSTERRDRRARRRRQFR